MNDDYKIEFKDKYYLLIDATEKYITLQFYNKKDKPTRKLEIIGDPTSISERSNVGSEIKRHLKDKNLSDEGIKVEFEETMLEIATMADEILVAKNEAHQIDGKLKSELEEDRINEGIKALEEMEVPPLIWIANMIDWYTAGERINILYAFITCCSQVILDNPISLIGIGETNSGKTHVVEVALLLLPQEYVFTIKTLTQAALFGYYETDPYFFAHKIVYIGDMGGVKDHEEAEFFKNSIKEMQTDGKIIRGIRVPNPDGQGWITVNYKLYGYPCLTYTTVPGYSFDGQELSRSVMFEPRSDNNLAVSIFTHLNDSKNSPTYSNIQKRRENIPLIQNMILALRKRMEDIEIYNPYNSFINNFLGESKYFKRDVKKYTGILKVITALNGYNREQINNTIFTTKKDIDFFLDLLSGYQEAIVTNLSPGAINVLDELRLHSDGEEDWDLFESGLTINDFIFKSKLGFAKPSVRRYFSELNNAGLVKVVDKDGQSNVYALLPDDYSSFKGDIEMDQADLKMLKYNYGIKDLSKYESDSLYTSPNDILESEEQPYWNDYLPENGYIDNSNT